MNDRIQLKQEEIVGNEVVLSDINPRTNTKSVDDSSSGTNLQQTIDRMWNTINNKLSRIVNSVNGRDGCVVVTSEDVGLGNVDNISFGDIKQWVINRMDQEFGYKQLICFESLNDLNVWVGEHNNDAIYDMKPFYVHKWSSDDLRGYIGVFAYESGLLNANHRMVIDTVGWTDNSIIYNEDVNDTHYSGTGKMGVNIWKYEDALEIYNDISGNKYDSGLRIKKENVVGSLYYFDGVYGTGEADDSHALVYFDDSVLPVDPSLLKTVQFYFNDVLLTTLTPVFLRQTFKIGDIILCDFNHNDGYYDENSLLKNGMVSDLVDRYQCIGMVITAPTMEHPEDDYVIKFYAIKPKVSNGLTYKDETIEINPLKAYHGDLSSYLVEGENISGLTTVSPHKDSTANVDGIYDYALITPWGVDTAYSCEQAPDADKSGIIVNLADSLCMIPKTLPLRVENTWPKDVHAGIYNDDSTSDRCDTGSSIGINLMKELQTSQNKLGMWNMSGLRITDPYKTINGNWWGNDSTNTVGMGHHSGGLSVNVGNFLEIGHANDFGDTKSIPITDRSNEHYDWGKVNVRIDMLKGLEDSDNNSFGVNINAGNDNNAAQGGLCLVNCYENGQFVDGKKALGVRIGMGMALGLHSRSGVLSDDRHVMINTIDPQTTPTETYNVHQYSTPYEAGWCGGLRYIKDCGTSFGAIGIRINEEAAWSTETPMKGPSYIGSQGLTINEHNVLGVQVAKGNNNIVDVASIQKIIEEKYDSIIFMPNPTLVYDKVEDFPAVGDVDTMYVSMEKGFKEHYIWNSTENTYENMYVFIGNSNPPEVGEFNKIYVKTIPNTSYDKLTTELYSWSYWHKTFLPSLDGDRAVDSSDASVVLAIYSALISGAPIEYWSNEIMTRADANQDGDIDSSDSSLILEFYADSQYDGSISAWRDFLHNEYDFPYDDRDPSHGWQKLYTDTILPGVSANIDEHRGLTKYHIDRSVGNSNTYDLSESLGISIHDNSAYGLNGVSFNKYKSGGLRFASDGVLAIRVNNDTTTSYETHNHGASDISQGDMGIGIDRNNVLGIQLTQSHATDNGMLAIDRQGNLIISTNYRPTVEFEKPTPLYIGPEYGDGVSYDGSNPEMILLGPGLVMVPNDEPDPSEAERLEERKAAVISFINSLLICDILCYYKYIKDTSQSVLNMRSITGMSQWLNSSKSFVNAQESFGPVESTYTEFYNATQKAQEPDQRVEFGQPSYQITLAEYDTNCTTIIDNMKANYESEWTLAAEKYFNGDINKTTEDCVAFLKGAVYYPEAMAFYNEYEQYLNPEIPEP